MLRASAIVVCAASAAMLAGCREEMRVHTPRSLKDDAGPTLSKREREPAKVEGPSVIDRAKAEQAARCGQRHIDHGKGALNESEEQKRTADATCSELHRYDYVR
jgi:hypothetical protein